MLHQRHRPGFQRFGHQRVVGVAEDLLRQRPGLGPDHAVLVAQQPHQLGHTDGRVRVVQVDGHLVGQVVEPAVLAQVAAEDVLDRGAGEEVLLAQPQLAPGRGAVVRVQHPGNVLELVLHLGGARVVTAVEGMQVDMLRRRRPPQPQRADVLGAMARHHHVVGLGVDLGRRNPARLTAAVVHMPAEAHREVQAAARELPGRAVTEPRVGVLDLPAFDDRLREHAVLVADAVAERRQAERGHRIQETGRQPAQAAVAQGGVGFVLFDVLELLRLLRQRCGGLSLQIQRGQRVAQRAPHQELHRQVMHPPAAALRRLRGHPALRQLFTRQLGDTGHQVGGRGLARRDADMVEQLPLQFGAQGIHIGKIHGRSGPSRDSCWMCREYRRSGRPFIRQAPHRVCQSSGARAGAAPRAGSGSCPVRSGRACSTIVQRRHLPKARNRETGPMNSNYLAQTLDLPKRTVALVLAGGRGSRLHNLTDSRAKPAVYFGGKFRIIDFALVQLPELRHSPHRRHHPVQEPQPAAPPAARLGLHEDRDERVRRPAAGAAAGGRGELVPGHRRCGVAEPGHPGRLRRRLRGGAGRRPCLQDELCADAGRPCGAGAPLHRGLHRGAAQRSHRPSA